MGTPNPMQLAPGEEAGDGRPIDTPFRGFDPALNEGESLNGSFWQGFAFAKPD